MDISDSQDESEAQGFADSINSPSKDDGYLSDVPRAVKSAPGPISHGSELNSFHKRKWHRLRLHYNDQYLDLFKETFERDSEGMIGGDLLSTQLGAVLWDPSEKARLYNGLCRKGRHDLQALSSLVITKSEVEIKAYLESLREQEADRQLFEVQPKNISHSEIPAAIEIGPDCEAVLDLAAEALSAIQEQYDFAANQGSNRLWLIDHETAAELDEKAGEARASDNIAEPISEGDDGLVSETVTMFFHLSTFLELSERFFMNKRSDDPDAWENLAEDGQRPTLTVDFLTCLYDLVVSLTRRLVQSCLFIANSRLRSSTSNDYKPSRLVKFDDVSAALAILNVQKDSQQWWIGLARRNGLKVVDSSHQKGVDPQADMAYDTIEALLATPSRGRSLSVPSEGSAMDEASSSDSSEICSIDAGDLGGNGVEDDDHLSDDRMSDSDEIMDSSNEQDDDSIPERHAQTPMSKQKRIESLEEEQDKYMERMDQEARKQEESRLLSLLGAARSDQVIKEEETKRQRSHPPGMRKTLQDCVGWSATFQADWERHGRVLPAESFSVVGSRTKRRRLNHNTISD